MCADSTPCLNSYQAMDRAMDTFERSWNRLLSMLNRTWNMFGMDTKVELAKQYAMQHPILTLCGVLTLCMCSIPVMCFMFFVMGSLLLTFLGFLFVEGFLLTFASVVLGGALFIVGLLSIGASSILAVAWCMLATGNGFVSTIKSKFFHPEQSYGSSLLNFFRFERTNEKCVKDVASYVDKKD